MGRTRLDGSEAACLIWPRSLTHAEQRRRELHREKPEKETRNTSVLKKKKKNIKKPQLFRKVN